MILHGLDLQIPVDYSCVYSVLWGCRVEEGGWIVSECAPSPLTHRQQQLG